nr:transcriptional regulator [Streptomyces filamentosus]
MTATTVRLTEDVPQRGVRRARAALLHPDRPLRIADDHLRVRLPAPHPMPLLADALVAQAPAPGLSPYEDPARYAAELADCYPGALVVAVHRGPHCWLRFGGRSRLLVREPGQPVQPWAVWASVAHVWLVAGLDPAALDPAAVRVVRTVRGYVPAPPRSRSSSDGPVPGAGGGGGSASGASGRARASGGSRAPSRASASTASVDPERPTESYRDSASR